MPHLHVFAAVAGLIALSFAPAATGHGGQYQRPRVPLGPVTGVDPSDAAKWTGPAFPTTIPSRSTRRAAAETEGTGWRLWWRANAPTLLQKRFGVDAEGSSTLRGRARDAATDWPPVRDALDRALLDPQIDVVDSAILAWGRCSSPESADVAFKKVWPYVGHPVESIRRSAVISLGLTGSDRAIPVLVSLLSQTSKTDPITNGIAAISLGYLSAGAAIPALTRTVEENPAVETAASAVVGLGLYRSHRREIVPFLVDKLSDVKLPREVRAQVPIALARLGDASSPAIPALVEQLRLTTEPAFRRSLAIALGQLASPEDVDVVRRLEHVADRIRDGHSRGLALLALAQIATRADGVTLTGDATVMARAHVMRRLTSPLHRADIGYSCLAAALAFQPVATDDKERVTVVERVGRHFRDRRTDAVTTAARGAAAIALALLGQHELAPEIRARAETAEDAKLKGDLITALGLLRDRGSLTMLRSVIEKDVDPATRERAIEAAGLISREIATSLLVRLADRTLRPSDRLLATQGLARIGGRAALPHLVRLANDVESEALPRAFAVVALGRMLERTRPPWNERLAANGNFAVDVRAIRELLDLF